MKYCIQSEINHLIIHKIERPILASLFKKLGYLSLNLKSSYQKKRNKIFQTKFVLFFIFFPSIFGFFERCGSLVTANQFTEPISSR